MAAGVWMIPQLRELITWNIAKHLKVFHKVLNSVCMMPFVMLLVKACSLMRSLYDSDLHVFAVEASRGGRERPREPLAQVKETNVIHL